MSCTSDRARETQAVLIGGLIRIRAGQLIVSSLPFPWRRQLFSWGSIYYLNYYNPSKENPGPLRHPFLELLEKKQLEDHRWGLGMGGISSEANGTWQLGLSGGERGGCSGRARRGGRATVCFHST